MPQLVALFNGVGGGAAAIVALLEFTDGGSDAPARYLAASAFTVLVGCVSFSGSVVTFLKLQELMTTRPVVVPVRSLGLDRRGRGRRRRWLSPGGAVRLDAACSSRSPLVVARARRAVRAAGRRRRRTDRHLAAQRVHRSHRRGVAATCSDNVLLLVAGTLVGASGTMLTRLMATAMGRPLTTTLFGAFSRGYDAWVGGAVSDRPVRSGEPRRRRDPARRTPARSSSSPATASRSPRRSTRCASSPTCSASEASRSSTASTPSPAGCPAT